MLYTNCKQRRKCYKSRKKAMKVCCLTKCIIFTSIAVFCWKLLDKFGYVLKTPLCGIGFSINRNAHMVQNGHHNHVIQAPALWYRDWITELWPPSWFFLSPSRHHFLLNKIKIVDSEGRLKYFMHFSTYQISAILLALSSVPTMHERQSVLGLLWKKNQAHLFFIPVT